MRTAPLLMIVLAAALLTIKGEASGHGNEYLPFR